MSLVLKDNQVNYYHTTVGQMRWSFELGRININLEMGLLSCYLAQPRHGHIDHFFHTFSFLKSPAKSKLVLDTFKNDFDG